MKATSLKIALSTFVLLVLTAGTGYAQALSNTATTTASVTNPEFISISAPSVLNFSNNTNNNNNCGLPNQPTCPPAVVNGAPVTSFFNVNVNYGGLVNRANVYTWIVSPNPASALTGPGGSVAASFINVFAPGLAQSGVPFSSSPTNGSPTPPLAGAFVLLGTNAAINGQNGNQNLQINNIYMQITAPNLPSGTSTGIFEFVAEAI
jgi:hypothetical protein